MIKKFESSQSQSQKIKLFTKSLTALIVDPFLKGIHLKARSCHLRTELLTNIEDLLAPLIPCKIHPQISDFDLYGGIDISKSTEGSGILKRRGIFGDKARFLNIVMAERIGSDLAGKLSLAIDQNETTYCFAIDEGIDDEKTPESIMDRLAFSFDLEAESQLQKANLNTSPNKIAKAKHLLRKVEISENLQNQLCLTAFKLGIESLRAPIFALRTAKALAAIEGRSSVNKKDFILSIQLTLAHKATRLPDLENTDNQHDVQNKLNDATEINSDKSQSKELETVPHEIIIEAIENILPKNILSELQLREFKTSNVSVNTSGAGQKKLSNRRGRPKPSVKAPYDGTKRLDLPSTLRSAVPWQKLRRAKNQFLENNIIIVKEDFCIRKYEEKSDRLIIFAVDASGSSAFGRLGEAKGAIEYLLADAYSNRDHIALVAFKGITAQLLLPATRSLVQAKKKLADLPAGGGTPIASGLEKAIEVAIGGKNKGLTPTIALMTDGKANISLEGQANKELALRDTYKFCSLIHQLNIPAIVIDTSNRPQQPAKDIAMKSNGKYIAMPKASAKNLSTTISNISSNLTSN